jgi:hypothetical protein
VLTETIPLLISTLPNVLTPLRTIVPPPLIHALIAEPDVEKVWLPALTL